MQTQVVHQPRATIQWIPALIAALLLFATVAGVQIAFRDRGTVAAPASVSSADDGALQKAQMAAAGVTNVSGVEGVRAATDPAVVGALGGSHPRTKFGSSEGGSGAGRDAALRATITRIEQAR